MCVFTLRVIKCQIKYLSSQHSCDYETKSVTSNNTGILEQWNFFLLMATQLQATSESCLSFQLWHDMTYLLHSFFHYHETKLCFLCICIKVHHLKSIKHNRNVKCTFVYWGEHIKLGFWGVPPQGIWVSNAPFFPFWLLFLIKQSVHFLKQFI